MEVIVLDDDSDEGDHISKGRNLSASYDAERCSRPAKRQRQEPPSSLWVSDTVTTADLSSVGVSHISDTAHEPSMTEAPLQPGSAAADDAVSPTLSPQQVRSEVTRFVGLFVVCLTMLYPLCCSKKSKIL